MNILEEKLGLSRFLEGITLWNLAILIVGVIAVVMGGIPGSNNLVALLIIVPSVNLFMVVFARAFAKGLYLEARDLRDKVEAQPREIRESILS